MSDRLRIALLLAPALALIAVLFFGGLAAALLRSVSWLPALGRSDPTLDAYRAVLADPRFLPSLALSLYIAVASTLIAAVLGIAAALLLRRPFAGRGPVTFLVQLNLTVPHAVGAIGLLYLIGQSGLFARLAYHAGLIDAPAGFPALVHDPWAVGIILHYVWKEVPFVALVVLAQLQTLGDGPEAAARTLGASRWQAFRHVLLPQILPAVLAAGAIVFAFAFGTYEVPLILGASHPPALPVLAYQRHVAADPAARPEAMALAVVIALCSALAIWAAWRLARGGVGR
jgi:putative spermidine/putrescine transport system permease protein